MNVIPAFGNHLPVRVRFGEGVASTLPDVLAELGATRVFLMVDEGIEQFNPAAAGAARRAGRPAPGSPCTRFDKPPAEPTIEMVDDATRALVASGATAVVALGGGSVIDTAKAARLCAQLGCTFAEFLADAARLPGARSGARGRARPVPAPVPRCRVARWCPTPRPAARTASPTPTSGPSTRWSTRC